MSGQVLRLEGASQQGKGLLAATHIWALMHYLIQWDVTPLLAVEPESDTVYLHLSRALEAVLRQLGTADVAFVLARLADGVTVAEAVAQGSAVVASPLGMEEKTP